MLNKFMKFFVNALTIFRCIFTFAMPYLISRISNWNFIIIVVILFLTDWVDGFLSRKCKVQTLFGSIADTIADKVLCIALILCIAQKASILYMVMIGEILIATINLGGTFGGAQIVSNKVGKAKMWVLAVLTIFGYMYYFGIISSIAHVNVVGAIAIIMQIVVIFMYSKNTQKVEGAKKLRYVFKSKEELKKVLFDTNYYLETIDRPLMEKLTIKEEV